MLKPAPTAPIPAKPGSRYSVHVFLVVPVFRARSSGGRALCSVKLLLDNSSCSTGLWREVSCTDRWAASARAKSIYVFAMMVD